MAQVVLVEPYYGGSHRAWADNWRAESRHDIALITLPDEFWRWRLRGGAVTMAEQLRTHVETHGRPDVVVVSGLIDLAGLAGLARRSLGDTPLAMYVHESQLLYPLAPNQRADTGPALTNWVAMNAADAVWFNSNFHRRALEPALQALLDAQPEPRHTHLVRALLEASTVLWPGVAADRLIRGERGHNEEPLVLWNQRWDHDKNPHTVFSALASLADDGVGFTLALAGQNQRPDNPDLAWIQDRLGSRIVHTGYLPDAEYEQLLLRSDVVVSAADHEFFGIAIVEAMAAGALPVLPDRLSFPELVMPQWHNDALYPDGDLRHRLRFVLTHGDEVRAALGGLRESMTRFDLMESAASHDAALDALLR